jgi:hypothetical protein
MQKEQKEKQVAKKATEVVVASIQIVERLV